MNISIFFLLIIYIFFDWNEFKMHSILAENFIFLLNILIFTVNFYVSNFYSNYILILKLLLSILFLISFILLKIILIKNIYLL